MATERVRRRRKEARPQEILDAAHQLFAEAGYAATTMDAIAERAGIAKGTVYRYFPKKEQLFEAMVRTLIAPVFAQLDGLTNVPPSAAESLTMVIRHLYQNLVQSPERRVVMKLVISEGGQFPHLIEFYHREILSNAERLLRRIVQQGVATGEFRVSAVTEEPRVLVGPAMMAVIWQMTFERIAPMNLDRFLAAHLDLVLHGLLKAPAESAETGSAET